MSTTLAIMQQEMLVRKAPAKINLSLRVLGRREDGYHLLATHMQKIGLCDELFFCPAAAGIELRCSGGKLPADQNNLVYRAAELFLLAFQEVLPENSKGIIITLQKNIPVAAGLGGGSSDAAATLLGLNQLYQVGCSPETLATMGLQLGADVPFFLDSSPAAMATGIGEILQPVAPLTDCQILLVNPGFSVSTRWVYQNFALTEVGGSGNLKNSQNDVVRSDCVDISEPLVNDLEQVSLGKYPQLAHIKAEMLGQGAEGALMSGSGPTVFGVFQDQQRALAAKAYFLRRYAHVFLVDPLLNN